MDGSGIEGTMGTSDEELRTRRGCGVESKGKGKGKEGEEEKRAEKA